MSLSFNSFNTEIKPSRCTIRIGLLLQLYFKHSRTDLPYSCQISTLKIAFEDNIINWDDTTYSTLNPSHIFISFLYVKLSNRISFARYELQSMSFMHFLIFASMTMNRRCRDLFGQSVSHNLFLYFLELSASLLQNRLAMH